MSEPKLCLFDDRIARGWEPFALTRPAGELLFGTTTLRGRVERVFARKVEAHLVDEHLTGFEEEGSPPVLTTVPGGNGGMLFLTSRFVPAWGAELPRLGGEAGAITTREGEPIGWWSPDGTTPPSLEELLNLPSDSVVGSIAGELLERVWQMIPRNPDQVAADIRALFDRPKQPQLPAGAHHWGKHPLIIDTTAHIEPGVAFDTSEGPIWIDRNAEVRAFSRLVGPAYIGPGSRVLGGPVEAVSVGPVCRVRGELAESICVGYVNKQHDGHMGHAYLGRWVNLGAETTNSDLKNNYGTIRLWTPEGDVDTGEIKMGSLIGDHVKTGIGLLLNTGTVIGAGSNLYGAEMPPKWVPPFSWGTGSELVEYRLDKFLEVAERAMERRDVTMSSDLRDQLDRAWKRGREMAGT